MPPKKDEKKGKNVVASQATGEMKLISEHELEEARHLPQLNDFVFTTLLAFKMVRNQARLKKQLQKQFQYLGPEDPGYSEEMS